MRGSGIVFDEGLRNTPIYPSDRPTARHAKNKRKTMTNNDKQKQAKMDLAVINALRPWRILVEAVVVDERDRCKKRTWITQLKSLSFL
jgi:hypothetical protein